MDQSVVNDFVGNAHGNFAKVQEIFAQYPEVLNMSAAWDETALGAASHMANREIATWLLEQGAPLDIFAAIILGKKAEVQAFLEADPGLANARGAHGIPILFYPVIVGDRETAEVLLSLGTDVNAGAGGNTALHGAAWFNQPAMAAFLLDRGARADAQDYQGKTALQVAEENKHTAVADLLREAK